MSSDNAKPGTVAVMSVGQSDGVPRHPDTAPGLAGLEHKMSSLPWFPFFPADFVSSAAVKEMTLEQVGAYSLLLNWQWLSNACVLLDDIPMLSRMVGTDMSASNMAIVLKKFPVLTTGYRGNQRLLEIYKDQSAKHLRRVEAGKQGHIDTSNAGGNAPSNGGSCTIQNSELRDQKSDNQSSQTNSSGTLAPCKQELTPIEAELTTTLCRVYRRRPTTEWDIKETRKLREIAKRKEVLLEFGELEAYYQRLKSRNEGKFFPHDIITLLNNWTSKVDAARKDIDEHKPRASSI